MNSDAYNAGRNGAIGPGPTGTVRGDVENFVEYGRGVSDRQIAWHREQDKVQTHGGGGGAGEAVAALLGLAVFAAIGIALFGGDSNHSPAIPVVKIGMYQVVSCPFAGLKKENSRTLFSNEWVAVEQIYNDRSLKVSAYKWPRDGTSRLGVISSQCLQVSTYRAS